MKHKLKINMQQAESKSSVKKTQLSQRSSWEMSAQDALRVDYVTAQRRLSTHS